MWSIKNFGKQDPYLPLLGIVEEVGELCHAHLKMKQRIRGHKDKHEEEAKDAIGDIVIYLADYCDRMEFDLAKCIQTAWQEVKGRDWTTEREENERREQGDSDRQSRERSSDADNKK